jgi:hypothetical protein
MNGGGSTSKFAISSVTSPLGASMLDERGNSGANGEASSPLLLGFSADALYIGGRNTVVAQLIVFRG